MKIYVAAMAKKRRDEVLEFQIKLRELGHTITYDWASADSNVKKPYRDTGHRKHNAKVLPKMLNGAASADVFILFDDDGLRGAYIEYGAFLREALKNPMNKQVFIVGKDSVDREHIFESPNFVHFVDDIDQVFQALL